MGFSANYHTHTYRCGHATGDAPEYARIAAAGGCRILGFSDHTPLPDGRWPDWRMRLGQLDEYEAAVARARAEQPDLTVLLGMECEYAPEFRAFYEDELFGRRGYDYLIGACHLTELDGAWIGSFDRTCTPQALAAYAATCTKTMEAGLFSFIAHPDLFGCCNPVWTADTAACARDICAASVSTGVPLEINGLGFRKTWLDTPEGLRPPYPWTPFWQVAAEHGVRVVLNSDAHHPQDVLASYDDVAAMRDRFALVEADLSVLTR
ncbi:MAG: histidinol-phosphatase [Planctomycetes bacterium]|nr:histidinol-phosphatase [Planctomycetota bacterium]